MSAQEIAISRESDGRSTVSSLVVAEKFGKRHDSVLLAIRNLDCSPEFMLHNFMEHTYIDSRGNTQPCVQMTRDGFTFLAMGFSGREAAAWKERFIAAFNAMESDLRKVVHLDSRILAEVVERQQSLTERLASNHVSLLGNVNHVTQRVENLDERVSYLEREKRKRREIADAVKDQHRVAFALRGKVCPCCMQSVAAIEFDHFFSNQHPDFRHTWPLCKPCHAELTHGRRDRPSVKNRFEAYQEWAAERLPSQLPLLPFDK